MILVDVRVNSETVESGRYEIELSTLLEWRVRAICPRMLYSEIIVTCVANGLGFRRSVPSNASGSFKLLLCAERTEYGSLS